MDKKLMHEKITRLLEDDPNLDVDEAIDKIVSESEVVEEQKEPPRLIKKKQTCKNFWCKSPFDVQFYEGEDFPKTCPKCDSFAYELSDGIESGEKQYEGPRQDGLAHEVEFHFSKYKQGKGFWNRKIK
jgi:hypothetical protein